MNDRRRANRHQLLFNARVYDAEQRRVLTRLVEDYDLRIGEIPAPGS